MLHDFTPVYKKLDLLHSRHQTVNFAEMFQSALDPKQRITQTIQIDKNHLSELCGN